MATTSSRERFLLTRMAGRMAGVLLLGASLAPAQLPTGAISGRVLDSSGAAIPAATVTATNRETGRVHTTETSASGNYKTILPVGVYDVRVEAPSFRSEVRQSLKLEVAQEAVLNFTLSVGSVQETVTVTAEAPLVDTTSGSLGGLVNEQRLSDLPLNGRNFNDLVLLQPGISVSKPVSGTAPINKGLLFSSNGAPIYSNYMMLDGANLLSLGSASGVSITGSMLGVEGIREFRVITNFFPAEYGMVMGSQLAVVSKGGTNEFHGSVFEFLRNSSLDARNFFDRKLRPSDPRLPAFRRNNFGGSFGGPIRKDKAFFFLTYEGVRESLGLSQVLSVPNAQARQDGFLVPTIAASVKRYLNLYPLPTEPLPSDPTGASGVGRFTYVFKQPTRDDYGQSRGDYNFSEKDSLFVRYTVNDTSRTRAVNFPGYSDTLASRGQYITLAENHTFSPALLNMFRFSYSRSFESTLPLFGESAGDPALGFNPGLQMGEISPGSGVTLIGANQGSPRPFQQQIFTVSNDMFWSRGLHSLKFGTLINRFDTFGQSSSRRRGRYTFANLQQFLLANPREYSTMTPGSVAEGTFRWSTYGFYLQDDWRVAPSFTLNIGLRYEFHSTVNETSGHGASLRDVLHDAQSIVAPPLFENPSLRNFSPRLGFAWDVLGDSSMSLRGGFGLLYNLGSYGWMAIQTVDAKPPFSSRSTVATNVGFPNSVIPPETAGKTIAMLDYHLQQPHLLQYNLTVERKLPAAMVFSLSYAGSRGLNLYNQKDGNPVPPSEKINGRDFWTGLEQRPNPNWGYDEFKTAASDSWYNSLQFSLLKRLAHGLQFQSSYTWSKLLDTSQGSDGGQSGGGGHITGTNPHNQKVDKGPADFDIRHSWAFNVLYELPSAGLGGVGHLLDGWRVGTILRVLSGQTFSPVLSGNRSRTKTQDGSTQDRPDLVAGRKPGDIILGGPNRYFDPTAFVIQPAGFLGTASRNMLQGPGQANLDFSLTKQFPLKWLGEGDRLEFRTEVFNLLNRANFYIPVGGRVVYTADQGRADTNPLSTAGQIDQTLGSARQMQFALKLIF